jgi:hypothetical protein
MACAALTLIEETGSAQRLAIAAIQQLGPRTEVTDSQITMNCTPLTPIELPSASVLLAGSNESA